MQPAGVLSVKQQAIHAELIYGIPFATYSIKLLINCPFVDVLYVTVTKAAIRGHLLKVAQQCVHSD